MFIRWCSSLLYFKLFISTMGDQLLKDWIFIFQPLIIYLYLASQMWCLSRLLPLMIGEMVSEQDPKWENFLLMLTITDYAFAPVTSEEIIPYLKSLIRDHHEAFKELYPNCPIIPKMHYLIHLPEWLLR